MTKQDFELVAEIVRNADADIVVDRARLADLFAGGLAHTNPRFDRARFIAACMGEDSTDSAGRKVRYSA